MLTREILYEIAKVIDNDFIGSIDTFTAHRQKGEYYHLSTNKCDWCSFVKVYTDDMDNITNITRLGPDTETWQQIHPYTMQRVKKVIN